MSDTPVTVSELVAGIRRLVEGVLDWQKIWVIGEIGSVRHHSSGHWYFTLKDEAAQMRAVMFRRDAQMLTAPLRDGVAVMAYGRVGVFERDGQTQLYVSMIREIGTGSQERELQRLKEQLDKEGLFSRPKQRVPFIPRAVAVITSPTGAARRDIESVIARRYPGMPIHLYPVLVQGKDAARSIVEALAQVSRGEADVVILGRGGGAKEDLAAFNEEAVVRAVAECPVPVISAVGHEIDTTLTDLAADLRAATPSAAAELAVPEYLQLQARHGTLKHRLSAAFRRRLGWEHDRLSGWTTHGLLANPGHLFREKRHLLDRLAERADLAFERTVAKAGARLDTLRAQLPLLDPNLPLARGYAYVTNADQQLVSRNAVKWGEPYEVHWQDGSWWMTRVERKDETDE